MPRDRREGLREARECVRSASREFEACEITGNPAPITNEPRPAPPITISRSAPTIQPIIRDDRRKAITISGKTHQLDPKQLCRIIMHTTQQIGEYKAMNNPYSAYVVNALRKARNDMVSDLETNFGIGHQIAENGRSVFYYL